VLDAVTLLLGGRGDSDDIRSGQQMAFIEGAFEMAKGPSRRSVEEVLAREQLDGETPGALVLTREVRRGGRSVCRVNGHTASLNVLKEIGQALVDIHGQSEHLSLLQPRAHLDLLDRYAGSRTSAMPLPNWWPRCGPCAARSIRWWPTRPRSSRRLTCWPTKSRRSATRSSSRAKTTSCATRPNGWRTPSS